MSLPLHEKKKIRADNYMRAGLYAKSLVAYQQLLSGSYAGNFSTESYGNILHNRGIAHFYTASFGEAERDFKDAYTRNHRVESLHHFLYMLLMQGREADFQRSCVSCGMNMAQMEELRKKYEAAIEETDIPEPHGDDVDLYKEELRKATNGAV